MVSKSSNNENAYYKFYSNFNLNCATIRRLNSTFIVPKLDLKTIMKKINMIALSVILMVIIVTVKNLQSNPTGAPAAASGGPAENGNTCFNSGCHTGSPSIVNNFITSDIPAEGYIPGTTYNVTVSVSGFGKKGFMFSAQKSNGTFMGSLTAGAGSHVSFTNYITHSSAKNTSPAVWTFKWTAPAAGSGAINFYGAFAATTNTTFKQTLTIQEKTQGTPAPILGIPLAYNITGSSVSLVDTIQPNGNNCNIIFQYKSQGGLWQNAAASPGSLNGNNQQPVTANLTGLQVATTYSTRALAIVSTDTTFSTEGSFSTLTPTGIAEQASKMDIKAFPNPAQDELILYLQQNQLNNTIRLWSLKGELVFSKECNVEDKIIISTKFLSRGMYFLEVSNEQQRKVTKILLN